MLNAASFFKIPVFKQKITQMENVKETVREAYTKVVKASGESACCGPTCCTPTPDAIDTFNDSYEHLEGYMPEADYGLGCGLPTEVANIQEGDTVLDLGSGAGNDVFVARSIVGEKGQVFGVDFTPAMIEKANANKAKLGFHNVHFVQGDIESLPLPPTSVDVVVSNCVMNLVPDKEKAFAEVYKVLKQGGHFSISDVVLNTDIPDKLRQAAELYAGCVSGAITLNEYLAIIKKAGFTSVEVKKSKPIEIPDKLLLLYMMVDELQDFRKSNGGIQSVTVYGVK